MAISIPGAEHHRAVWRPSLPVVATALTFAALFWEPAITLVRDWWNDPDAGHGLLLAPVALYLAWRSGKAPTARSEPIAGTILLIAAVGLRAASALAAEMFTMRFSMLMAGVALVVFARGIPQVRHWWLPAILLALTIPLPAVLAGTLALPLQFKASQLGTALLEMRNVPVRLAGNVIYLPGQSLFVTEACSGLRSLTALLSLGVMLGGIWLRSPWSRLAIVGAAIPVAMVLNGLRIFLTGFLVFYVDPRLGDGVMHLTEGWALFVVAFGILGALTWTFHRAELALARARS